MTSLRRLDVDPTQIVASNAYQIQQHLESVTGKGNRTWLVDVVKVHRHLRDLHVVSTCYEKALQVEAESLEGLTREDRLSCLCGKSLQSRLSIQNPGEQHSLRKLVEYATHYVARVEIMKELGAHDVARLGQCAAGNGDIATTLEGREQFGYLARTVREVGIQKDSEGTRSREHSSGDSMSLASIPFVTQKQCLFVRLGEAGEDSGGDPIAAVVNENHLRDKVRRLAKVTQVRERGPKLNASIPCGNNY